MYQLLEHMEQIGIHVPRVFSRVWHLVSPHTLVELHCLWRIHQHNFDVDALPLPSECPKNILKIGNLINSIWLCRPWFQWVLQTLYVCQKWRNKDVQSLYSNVNQTDDSNKTEMAISSTVIHVNKEFARWVCISRYIISGYTRFAQVTMQIHPRE